MDKYTLALKIGAVSFAAMFLLLIFLVALPENTVIKLEQTSILNITGLVLTLTTCVPGYYLWFTGFKRFKHIIGTFGLPWIIYVSLLMFSGYYMQYRYGNEAQNS